MTGRGILLRLLMDELGIDAQLRTFGSRLRLQKSVYLLQALGLPTHFSYGWYLRGPYSRGLTEAAFEEVAKADLQGDKAHESYSLTSETVLILARVKKMTAKAESVGLSQGAWLELLASMLFYHREMYFPAAQCANRADPKWLYRQLPPSKQAMFTEDQAVVAARELRVCEELPKPNHTPPQRGYPDVVRA